MYNYSNIMESPLLNNFFAVRDVYVNSKISINEPLMTKIFSLFSVIP